MTDWAGRIQQVPPPDWIVIENWSDLRELADGSVVVTPDGRPGVLDRLDLGDLIVENSPDPHTDERVQHYMRAVRANRPLRPLRVDLVDGSLVLTDGGCRYAALVACGRSQARAIIQVA